ncbi:alpha/beta fold hydrolase [Chlorogloeopsis sp. ULAP01]|uniref:alpha/beta hydrolase n=1 Tax=Chlorogloeopsis sp. ULAP01 TaxID=3056483 RepID=UPI0025AB43E0|nr:alpha/beta hydrolase [Chlorogloeopsis sp. ULAP01]MDM9384231.1 alpha/beta fold hydrolase [Chlorogloeopsis sp. ULAP01]
MNSFFGKWTSILKKSWVLLVLSMLLPTFGLSYSALTAQRIYASYSVLEYSIPVADLEKFAKHGVVDEELAFYLQFLKPKQIQELRQALITPIKVHPVAVSQFLYTPLGEFLLHRLTEAIKTKSRKPKAGFAALRSALILAAKEPDGLTLMNLVRKYPSSSIQIDLARTLNIVTEVGKMLAQTNRAVAAVSEQEAKEAATIPSLSNLSHLPDLTAQGRFELTKQTLKFFDPARTRLLVTDIYLPNILTKIPVILISHGLGTDSSNFQYLATHLASHGFAVIVPNHSGSDTEQLRSLSDAKAADVAMSAEIYQQPLDVKYILNQLQADSRFNNRLNLQQVGVFGQSLGAHTALTLAGAKINFEQLKRDCNQKVLKQTWNLSLLLQCRALAIRDRNGEEHNLYDERVKAVIAVNPITSSIFGEAGLRQIQAPVMIVASSDDAIAPAAYEQILPFSWIANSQKYLVLLRGGTHFSVIGEGKASTEQATFPLGLVGDNPQQAHRYINALSLPFFKNYVAGIPKYSPYLNATYAKSISNQAMGLSLIQSLTFDGK